MGKPHSRLPSRTSTTSRNCSLSHASSSTRALVFQRIRRCNNLRHSSFLKRISFRIPALHEERFTFHASEGGQIVAEGRLEQVAKVSASHTGRFLAGLLCQLLTTMVADICVAPQLQNTTPSETACSPNSRWQISVNCCARLVSAIQSH
jgi:hypothetical protein